jgi:hypothetical protein
MRNMNGQKTLTPEEKALWQRAIDVLVSAGFTAEMLTDSVMARFLKHAGDAKVRNAQTAQRASQGHGTGRSQEWPRFSSGGTTIRSDERRRLYGDAGSGS